MIIHDPIYTHETEQNLISIDQPISKFRQAKTSILILNLVQIGQDSVTLKLSHLLLISNNSSEYTENINIIVLTFLKQHKYICTKTLEM